MVVSQQTMLGCRTISSLLFFDGYIPMFADSHPFFLQALPVKPRTHIRFWQILNVLPAIFPCWLLQPTFLLLEFQSKMVESCCQMSQLFRCFSLQHPHLGGQPSRHRAGLWLRRAGCGRLWENRALPEWSLQYIVDAELVWGFFILK